MLRQRQEGPSILKEPQGALITRAGEVRDRWEQRHIQVMEGIWDLTQGNELVAQICAFERPLSGIHWHQDG